MDALPANFSVCIGGDFIMLLQASGKLYYLKRKGIYSDLMILMEVKTYRTTILGILYFSTNEICSARNICGMI